MNIFIGVLATSTFVFIFMYVIFVAITGKTTYANMLAQLAISNIVKCLLVVIYLTLNIILFNFYNSFQLLFNGVGFGGVGMLYFLFSILTLFINAILFFVGGYLLYRLFRVML